MRAFHKTPGLGPDGDAAADGDAGAPSPSRRLAAGATLAPLKQATPKGAKRALEPLASPAKPLRPLAPLPSKLAPLGAQPVLGSPPKKDAGPTRLRPVMTG